MKKKIIIFVIALLLFPLNALAKPVTSCDSSEFSHLKRYATNINVIYDYYIENNEAYFNVTINNVTPGMYILDDYSGQRFYYDDVNKGELILKGYKDVTRLKFTAYSSIPSCMDSALTTLYVNLPIYNKYANDPLCENNKEYRLCQRFLASEISRDDFERQIKKYIEEKNTPEEEPVEEPKPVKNFNSWQDILIRYSPLAIIILIALLIFIAQRRKKKNSFDFKL